MGYSTNFEGVILIEPTLTKEQSDYINLLCSTRRMKRDIKVLWEMYKGEHGNPFATEKTPIGIYGHEGEYFAKEDGGDMWYRDDKSIIDINVPPGQMATNGLKDFNTNAQKKKKLICQPGLWCQWEITEEGKELQWNGGEKFYDYINWLKYLIDRFFQPWGVLLNGEIEWTGEDPADMGKIVVKNNVVKIQKAVINYVDED